jgi:cytosine/adenosine deaminase-related metal-dependent hydrolase
MKKTLIAVLGLLLVGACRNSGVTGPNDRLKVLIGATLVPGHGSPAIEDSIIVVAGSKIKAFGQRKDVPVPQASDRTDLTGKWVMPDGALPIAVGEPANLLILDRAPNGAAPPNPADIGARLVQGEWKIISNRP